MAYQSIWYHTGLPKDIVNILDDYVSENFDSEMRDSELLGKYKDKNKRNSENAWIDTNHWIAGFIWHYVNKANRENFRYDLTNIDGENHNIQSIVKVNIIIGIMMQESLTITNHNT